MTTHLDPVLKHAESTSPGKPAYECCKNHSRVGPKQRRPNPLKQWARKPSRHMGLQVRGPWRLSEILILSPRYTRSDESSSPPG